ncbi:MULTISPECIES: hypothetical protein [unclassified Butyrivibrio]|uniref:hypothetical protein n=1 Tax=unclassified Butyrivibrio TaxID=2639466 RepID=UPI00040CE25E|nr:MULTISPECIES: hypothetical protein [unclassified Butyrivibrio]
MLISLSIQDSIEENANDLDYDDVVRAVESVWDNRCYNMDFDERFTDIENAIESVKNDLEYSINHITDD